MVWREAGSIAHQKKQYKKKKNKSPASELLEDLFFSLSLCSHPDLRSTEFHDEVLSRLEIASSDHDEVPNPVTLA